MAREPQRFVVLGFQTTHDALDAEALLGDVGINVVPIPAPKSIGAMCGIALRLAPTDETRATTYLGSAGIAVAGRAEIDDV
jgi:Putative Se/S carrier protein-like